MSGRKNRGAGKTILLMLYVLLFLSGLSLLLYPKLNAIWIDYMLHRDAAEFLSFVYTDTYIPREDTSHVIIRNPEPTEPEETLPDEYPELWQQMRAYNEDIFRNGQEGLSGETAYEKPSFILADYGLESEVFAVLSIPKLDLEMPLYLGATKRHMADGAAHMSETSLPIGGINTNCVIAGHRGWNGAAYFLYIPSLEKGDIRDTFLTPENIQLLETLGPVRWNESTEHLTSQSLRDALEDVDVIVCSWGVPKFDHYVLEKAKNLKMIAYVCGSVNNIVTDEVFNRGIHILSGNDEFARSVAEGIVCYVLAALRRIPQTVQSFAERGWPTEDTLTESLLEQNVGIVGLGAISRYLIPLLKPFDVRIKLFSNHTSTEEAAAMGAEKASLEEIFSSCKIISINSARSPKNYHMINDKLMCLLSPNSLLVNTSRGDLIDEAAMAEHLKLNHFRAILDVYEEEPLSMSSPLRGLENAILIPHKGGPTIDRRAAAARIVIEDIQNMMEGKPLKNEISRSRAAMMTHQ